MDKDEVAYKVEQALLPLRERDCSMCRGKGCDRCDHKGTYEGWLLHHKKAVTDLTNAQKNIFSRSLLEHLFK